MIQVVDVQVHEKEQQLNMMREIMQQEAYTARIAHESALHHSTCLQLELNARRMAEEKVSVLEKERMRWELDLAEAECSLKRKHSEEERASSNSWQQLPCVQDANEATSCKDLDNHTTKTHKQNHNKRRRAMQKHKQDRICDAEL